MCKLFVYNGPVAVYINSEFLSHAYLTLRRSSNPSGTSGEVTFTGHISGLPECYCDGTVLTLEMYSGATLKVTLESDGTIKNVGDICITEEGP
jgi:hypothetical protein